ncbi:MAG: hypothetical protein WD077_03755 [Bacteroidia bacterium]
MLILCNSFFGRQMTYAFRRIRSADMGTFAGNDKQGNMRFFTFVFCLCLMSACGVHYVSPRFDAQTSNHKLIAIIPCQIENTGRQPAKMTQEHANQIEEAESRMFQLSLYNSFLRKSGRGKNAIKVEIQPVEKTLFLLQGKEIGIRESWSVPAESLAVALGVDAVVKTRISKKRFLSDLESFGIDFGTEVLEDLLEDVTLPPDAEKTYDIKAETSLFNGTDGSLLWKVAVDRQASWDYPPEEVLQSVTNKFARKFPYRK